MSILVLGFSSRAGAQTPKNREAQPATQHIEQGQVNRPPSVSITTLTAKLVDAENKARQKATTVEVTVSGIELIDPAKVNETSNAGQGHIHYQLDDGPVIATTTTKLSFHGLSAGEHKIVVMLAANDHKPLGPSQTLNVTIP